MWLKCTVHSFKLLFWHTYKMIQYLDWRLKVIFSYLQTWYYKTNQIPAKFFYRLPQNNNNLYTMYCKFPNSYCKSVLHLLKYTTNLYFKSIRCSTDCGKFWDTPHVSNSVLYKMKPLATRRRNEYQHNKENISP